MPGKLVIALLLIALFWNEAAAQSGRQFADSVLVAKNFPLLNRLQNDKQLKALVLKNKTFRRQAQHQRQRMDQALKDCNLSSCYATGLQWTQREIETIERELVKLYNHKKAIRILTADLREQKRYALYDSLPDTAFLARAWRDAAAGINRIFNVYVKGEAPRYAKIDSISFPPGDTALARQVRTVLQANRLAERQASFFNPSLGAALDVLALNGRDEAARYEPLFEGLNKAPYEKIKTINFSAYPYSAVLVPGLGPEDPAVVLDPQGARRCEEGVKRWRQGLAPFIVVSGGNVHPFKTPYNEAVEMKKYMVEQLKVPAEAIFIEPHARHTTTNIRNTSRMIYRFGIPADKPVLIVTDEAQSSYITGRMDKTVMRDLGYLPYQRLSKISNMESAFYPVPLALHTDPFDPLDP